MAGGGPSMAPKRPIFEPMMTFLLATMQPAR